MIYPETRRGDVVDQHFGQMIADPYRWLETDVRSDPDVAEWVKAQNETTNGYLRTLPGREVFKDRLTKHYDTERFTAPYKRRGRYFYTHNSGLQNQEVLYFREGINDEGRVLIDANIWSTDGATALAEWSVSQDGAHVAFAVQDGGTDWRTIKVLDVDTGRVIDDEAGQQDHRGSRRYVGFCRPLDGIGRETG